MQVDHQGRRAQAEPGGKGRSPALRIALGLAALSAGLALPLAVPAATGSAGGATAVDAEDGLRTCAETVGTVRLQDGGGGNSLDSLRLLIQQSNCFVIVDRGAFAEAGADDEKRRSRSDNSEVRDGSNMGQGQEVAADFVLRSTIISMGTNESKGVSLGALGKFLGGGNAGQSVTQAKVQLVLSDVRAKIQISVAQGDSSGKNTKLSAGMLGHFTHMLGGGGVTSEKKSDGNTILLQALSDAYNKLVPAVQNYKTQTVRGGLGKGGTLKVQGAQSDPGMVGK